MTCNSEIDNVCVCLEVLIFTKVNLFSTSYIVENKSVVQMVWKRITVKNL